MRYSKKSLSSAIQYTNYLKTYKRDISARNINLAGGYNPDKPISKKNEPLWVKKILYGSNL